MQSSVRHWVGSGAWWYHSKQENFLLCYLATLPTYFKLSASRGPTKRFVNELVGSVEYSYEHWIAQWGYGIKSLSGFVFIDMFIYFLLIHHRFLACYHFTLFVFLPWAGINHNSLVLTPFIISLWLSSVTMTRNPKNDERDAGPNKYKGKGKAWPLGDAIY